MPKKLLDNVTFITYCCPKDIHKLYAPGALTALVESYNTYFKDVIIIRQHCRDIDVGTPEIECRVLEAEDYPDIRHEFGIWEDNQLADFHTGPSNSKYWWKNHCWNQLIGLKEASTDYVILSDCDIALIGADYTWVERGIEKLMHNNQILMVSPGHGCPVDDITKNISQISAIVNRDRFLHIDYETPLAAGETLGAFHFLFEGRVWRYATAHNLRRLVLANPRIIHYAW